MPVNTQWEEAMHMALGQHILSLEERFPVLKAVYHTPNGGKRSHRRQRWGLSEVQRFHLMLTRPGVPDLLCHTPSPAMHFPEGSPYQGFAFELKCKRNSTSPEQKWWLQYFEERGYLTGVYYDDWVKVWDAIKAYFGIELKEEWL